MNTTIKLCGKTIELNSVWENKKPSNWDTTSHCQHHKIFVGVDDETISFDFWASKAKNRITEEKEVVFAFYCFLTDSLSAENTFSEFCGEFGYDQYDEYGIENKRAKTCYNGCLTARNKFGKLFSGVDIYDMVNEMIDKYEDWL